MLYAACELGMSPRKYLAEHTEEEHLVWIEWFHWRNSGFGPDLSMEGLVPKETQERWERLHREGERRKQSYQFQKAMDAKKRGAASEKLS